MITWKTVGGSDNKYEHGVSAAGEHFLITRVGPKEYRLTGDFKGTLGLDESSALAKWRAERYLKDKYETRAKTLHYAI
jgi:hypothetical protein